MYTNCLPQYFFGDKMNQDEQSNKTNINLSDDVHINVSSIPSPSSSLASTKKLEWDSGADIGYIYDSVKNHRKSKSYPSLNMDQTDVNPMSIIGEGDTPIPLLNKKLKSFKHSTPLDNRVLKSCGDSPLTSYDNKDESLQTSVLRKSSKEVQTEQTASNTDKSLQTDNLRSSTSSSTSKSSKSSSFKYIPGSEINSYQSQKSSSTSHSSNNKTESSESGSFSPLGQMISTQHSQNLITDIDRSLAILQKFIKSKNYSNDTKKHYAKKIVTKIITNRYSEDSDSVDTPQSTKLVDCGTQCDEIQKKTEILTEQSTCQIKESLDKLNALQVDLKNWRDAQTLSEKLFEARKSKTTRPSSSTVHDRLEKPDYLLQHSKNERKRQLSWINNEIVYLQKLKDMLQTREQSNQSLSSTLTSSKKSSVASIDDIERRFNEEFGIKPTSPSLRRKPSNKLSKYLKNEEIKTIIVECDKHKKEESFDSHKNTIYVDKTECPKEKKPVPVDAATQYSYTETKNPSLVNKAGSDDTSSNCDESLIVEQPKPPIRHFINNEQQTSPGRQFTNNIEQRQEPPVRQFTHSIEQRQGPPVRQFTNRSEQQQKLPVRQVKSDQHKPPIRHMTNNRKNLINNVNKKLSTAYFLTFQEDSQCEAESDERKGLEEVVVKIPKRRPVNVPNCNINDNNNASVKVTSRGCPRSLEDYLLRNRPDFVQNANWRWTQVRTANQQNVFTCFEMKEMARKKYNKLPEVQARQKDYKTLVERTQNRLIANMFSKKLQKKTLQGHICLATCKSVLAD